MRKMSKEKIMNRKEFNTKEDFFDEDDEISILMLDR